LDSSDILNIAGCNPRTLAELFVTLKSLGISPAVETAENDVLDSKLTHGSNQKLEALGYSVPTTTLEDGVAKTLDWLSNINRDKVKSWYEFSK
jgi:nucleoside-diphosphate-sugar epimerase